jgi:hypothetical protein
MGPLSPSACLRQSPFGYPGDFFEPISNRSARYLLSESVFKQVDIDALTAFSGIGSVWRCVRAAE